MPKLPTKTKIKTCHAATEAKAAVVPAALYRTLPALPLY